jgi:olfactory receptor
MMAYDCFVANYEPMRYIVIMNPGLCVLLIQVSWMVSVLNSLIHSMMVLLLSFYGHLGTPHFFCEVNQVIYCANCHTFVN